MSHIFGDEAVITDIPNAQFGEQTGFDPNRQDLGLASSIPAPLMQAIFNASIIPAYDSERFADWATQALNNYYLVVDASDVPVEHLDDLEAIAASEAAAQAARQVRC